MPETNDFQHAIMYKFAILQSRWLFKPPISVAIQPTDTDFRVHTFSENFRYHFANFTEHDAHTEDNNKSLHTRVSLYTLIKHTNVSSKKF